MSAVLQWVSEGLDEPLNPEFLTSSTHTHSHTHAQTKPAGKAVSDIATQLWRGSELGKAPGTVVSSGFTQLDQALPGGGWPYQSLTELLQVQAAVCEWRLLAPAMRQIVKAGKPIVLVGSPMSPHLSGLLHLGVDERHLIWIRASTPAERLWVTEQLIKANAAGLILSWLPQARAEQIRRLQVCAQNCESPIFLCRPMTAEHESSAAPLRLQVRVDMDWALKVHILKRRGPKHEGLLALPSIPSNLQALLTPRLRMPSTLIAARHATVRHVTAPHVSHTPELAQLTQSPLTQTNKATPYVVGRPHSRRTASPQHAAAQ
jgi:protein ImuA